MRVFAVNPLDVNGWSVKGCSPPMETANGLVLWKAARAASSVRRSTAARLLRRVQPTNDADEARLGEAVLDCEGSPLGEDVTL